MFKVSQTDGSFNGFIKLLGIHPFTERGVAFYRPIFREALHNIYFSIFGLNHIPFRILLFSIHFLNIFLVYTLIQSIFKKKFISLFAAFFFGISAANVSTLYYLSGGIEASGATMFALLALVFYNKFIITKREGLRLFSLLCFILALSSHEIILSTPIILSGLVFVYYPNNKWVNNILKLWPFFLTWLVIIYIDFFKIGFSESEKQYQLIFNLKTLIQSFTWYWLWSFGLPETLIDFVLPGLKLNPNLIRYWGDYYKIIFPAFAISFSFLLIFILYLFSKSKGALLDKRFIFLLFWFTLGILPVILLPSHKSSHYLIFALPAFWGAVMYICFNFFKVFWKINQKMGIALLAVFLSSTFLLSAASAKLGEVNYWAAIRGKLAERLIIQVKSAYPSLPKGSIIYFKNDPDYPFLTKEWGGSSKQASLILNGSDALQLLYKDPTLKVYYEDLKLPSENKIYPLVAKIF